MSGQDTETAGDGWTSKPTPRRKAFRAKLTNTREVAQQAARLFREARAGLIDVQDASRLANILAIVGRLLSDAELEALNARMDAIEQRGVH
ncbi:MAG: hypothetical protein ACOY45_08355 [Pseudomonadota bacterium]